MIHRIPSYPIFSKWVIPVSSSIFLPINRVPSPIYSHFFESEFQVVSFELVSPLFFWRTVGPSPMCEAYCGGYAKGAAMKRERQVGSSTSKIRDRYEQSCTSISRYLHPALYIAQYMYLLRNMHDHRSCCTQHSRIYAPAAHWVINLHFQYLQLPFSAHKSRKEGPQSFRRQPAK